jgi:CO/xanthine dehydrogenase Mo-binding subunit
LAPRKKSLPVQDPLFHPDPEIFDRPKGEIFGMTLRSTTSHGQLTGMVHPPLPEGFTLVLHKDIPGNETFQVMKSRFPTLNGGMLNYIGEPIALVAGPTEAEVRAWAQKVRFVFRKASIEDFSARSLDVKVKTLSGGHYIPDESLETLRVEGIYSTGTQDAGIASPCEVLANVRPDEVALKANSQWPGSVAHSVARALDVPPVQVKVLGKPTSAHQNGQVWFPSVLAVHAALLSKAAGQPVRMRLTKEEEFLFSPKRPESRALLRSTVDTQGRILDFSADVVINVGAYGILEEEQLDRCLIALLAPYRVEAYQVNAHLESSHTPPRGPIGGMGENLGTFALESHIQDICIATGVEPLAWRQKFALTRDQIAFTGEAWKSDAPLSSLVSQIGSLTDFSRKYASFTQLNNRTREWRDESLPLRGIGLAAGFQGNGFLAGGTSTVGIEARLEASGDLFIYSPLVTANEHLDRLWRSSAAAPLQISPEKVHICPIVSGDHPTGGPSLASRAFEILPKIFAQLSETLAERRIRQPLPLTVKKLFRRRAGPTWNPETFTGQPFLSLSWVAAVAEIEVLPILAEVRVKKITLLVDAGPIVDEAAARDALTEGILFAVGWVFSENITWDKLMISRSVFRKYRLPSVREVPRIELHFFDNPRFRTPKGLGSLGSTATAPALLSAIRQAINPDWRSLPVTRKMLDEALRNHENQLDLER